MDVYASEDEQIEAIKKWWKDNGIAVVLGVILGAGALFGWRFWESRVSAQGEEASVAYMQLGNLITENKDEKAESVAQSLIEKYQGTPYASFSALALAKKAAEAGENDNAIRHLQWVIDNAELPEIKQTASLRLARVYLAKGDSAAAWKLIEPMANDSKLGSVHELKGDILLAQKKTDEARNAYLQALALTPRMQSGPAGAADQGSSFLEMKLDDLGTAGE